MRHYRPRRREPAPCGTTAGARRHWRNHEPACQACLKAGRRAYAERVGGVAGASSPDFREIRNGMPEFVPYHYRGTGVDQYAYMTRAELEASIWRESGRELTAAEMDAILSLYDEEQLCG